MQTPDNPFKAPEARVGDFSPPAGSFIPEGRRVPAGNGAAWLGRGWDLFIQAPLAWILLSLIFLILIAMGGAIHWGFLFVNLFIPVFVGGIMIGCKSLEDGGELRIDHLFAGLSEHAGSLFVVGLIYLGGIILLSIAMILLLGGTIGFAFLLGNGNMDSAAAGAAAGMGILALLLVMLFFVPLAMAVWFAPPLIIFHDMQPLQALKASFLISLKNFMPFLVYGLCFIPLAIVASLPLGLGWLVLIPVMQASTYAGYRDMFIADQ